MTRCPAAITLAHGNSLVYSADPGVIFDAVFRTRRPIDQRIKSDRFADRPTWDRRPRSRLHRAGRGISWPGNCLPTCPPLSDRSLSGIPRIRAVRIEFQWNNCRPVTFRKAVASRIPPVTGSRNSGCFPVILNLQVSFSGETPRLLTKYQSASANWRWIQFTSPFSPNLVWKISSKPISRMTCRGCFQLITGPRPTLVSEADCGSGGVPQSFAFKLGELLFVLPVKLQSADARGASANDRCFRLRRARNVLRCRQRHFLMEGRHDQHQIFIPLGQDNAAVLEAGLVDEVVVAYAVVVIRPFKSRLAPLRLPSSGQSHPCKPKHIGCKIPILRSPDGDPYI